MAEMKAGFGVSVITPRAGAELTGYANRDGPSTGVHDDLHSRALVVEGDGCIWALSANELLSLSRPAVGLVRQRVAERTSIPAENVLVCTVHTHSGPHDDHGEDWARPLVELIADAVVAAYERRVPARVGAGRGRLAGWSINRRFIDRPVDPGLAVLRVERLDGRPLGLVVNWNCHAVVLGYDNLLISADYPGVTSRALEAWLGADAVALFVNGGAGDVNPLTSGVRRRLEGDRAVVTMVEGPTYYGGVGAEPRFHIGDRGGGTFDEVEELGEAVAAEARRVAEAVEMESDGRGPWAGSVQVPIRQAGAPPVEDAYAVLAGDGIAGGWDGRAEVATLGVGDMALVGEPGEVFSETSVAIKRHLWLRGHRVPMVAGYANGFSVYLPPTAAFAEGGYEVDWARRLGLREDMQTLMWDAIEPLIPRGGE